MWIGAAGVRPCCCSLASAIAHVFEEFASRFTEHFHVVGLTRRGFGESDKPEAGYDARTRVEDIHQFLNALKIDRVNLVGHSMAGDELTLFATLYSERVKKLVYLDAAHDRTPQAYKEYLRDPVFIHNTTDRGMRSRRMFMEVLDLPGASEVVVKDMLPPEQWAVLIATHRAMISFHADYTRVRAPALAFYATSTNAHYPSTWLPKEADETLRTRAGPMVAGQGTCIFACKRRTFSEGNAQWTSHRIR